MNELGKFSLIIFIICVPIPFLLFPYSKIWNAWISMDKKSSCVIIIHLACGMKFEITNHLPESALTPVYGIINTLCLDLFCCFCCSIILIPRTQKMARVPGVEPRSKASKAPYAIHYTIPPRFGVCKTTVLLICYPLFTLFSGAGISCCRHSWSCWFTSEDICQYRQGYINIKHYLINN